MKFRLVDWILGPAVRAEYDFTSSGLSEPLLGSMGLETSYDKFAKDKGDHEKVFVKAVAELYDVELDNVVVTVGASEAIFLAYSVFGHGGRAVVPLPNYEPMFTVPRSLGMKVGTSIRNPESFTGAIVGLTNPNNPTGRRMGNEAVEGMMWMARRKKAVVFVNETYREFAFERKPRTLFKEYDDIITSSTMTKFYGLGWLRVGWLFAKPWKALQLKKAKRLISGHDSEYSLWLARQALIHRAAFVRRAMGIYRKNREIVLEFMGKTPGLSWSNPDAAPFCLVGYEGGPDSVTLAKLALKKVSVAVAPGDYFGAPKAFRLCFTGEEEALREGLKKLSGFLKRELA